MGLMAIRLSAQVKPLPDFTQTAPIREFQKEGLPKAASTSRLFGINAHWGENGGREGWDKGSQARRIVERMKGMGVTNVRVLVRWAEIEQERGAYDFKDTDRFLRFLSSQGFSLTVVVEGTPAWAMEGGKSTLALFEAKGIPALASCMAPDAKYVESFGKFATELGRRYKGTVSRWEVWNEPDGRGMPSLVYDALGKPRDVRMSGDAGAYTRLLKAFVGGMRLSDATAKIAIGGLSVPNTRFLEGIYVNGGKGAFDAVALHPVQGNSPLDFAWIDACRNLLVTRNDLSKPFWVTEWGWNAYPADPMGVSEGEQARLVREGLSGMRLRSYIEQANYQALNDGQSVRGDSTSVHSYGLCDKNLEPRLAYSAFQSVAFSIPAPLNRFRTLPILSNIPASYQENCVNVLVDTTKPKGAFPKLWRGMTPSESARGVPSGNWEKIAPLLANDSTMVVRLIPLLAPNAVEVDAEGSFVLHTEVVDAVFEAISQKRVSLIVSLTPPPAISIQHWDALVSQMVKRYSAENKYRILRWELSATPEQARLLYPGFTRGVLKETPGALLGCRFTSKSPLSGLDKFMESCVANGLNVPILGWRVTESAEELGRTLIALRTQLNTSPAFRSTRLLPEITAESTESQGGHIAQALRLLDYCPTGQANELQSLLADQSALTKPNGDLSPRTGTLLLLNRMAGTRLLTQSDAGDLRALGSRGTDGVRVLLWREQAQGIRMIRLRLQGLGGVLASQSRAYRVKVFSHQNVEEPILICDVPLNELEVPLLIDRDEVLLVEIKPVARPAFLVTSELPRFSYRSGNALEGDVGIRNLTTASKPFEMVISTSLSRIVPMGSTSASKGTLRPNVTRIMRYALPIPTVFHPTPAYVNFEMGKTSYAGVGFLVESALLADLPLPVLDAPQPGATVEVPVRVKNQGLIPFSITLRSEDGKENSFSLPKGGALTQTVPCKAPLADPGNYPIKVTVESLSDFVASLRPMLRVPLLCRYTEKPLKIDGNLDEWDRAVHIDMARLGQIRSKEWGGVLDLSGEFALQWDNQYLYIAAEVQDDTFLQSYTGADLWRGDSILVGVTASRASLWEKIGYEDGDHEFGMALLEDNRATLQRFAGVPAENAPRPQIAIRRDGKRLYYEAAIPWAQLRPLTPKPELLFGLGLLFSDEDGQGRGMLEWGSGLGEVRRPAQFPTIRLVR
jgi:hypothetical protein